MHATELMRNHTTRYCVFAIDSDDYITMLPTTTRVGSGELNKSTTCCAGSIARSVDGKNYMLKGSDQWVEYSGPSGGSGGGSVDIEAITDGEIENLFGNGGGNDQPVNSNDNNGQAGDTAETGEDNGDGFDPNDITDGDIESLF